MFSSLFLLSSLYRIQDYSLLMCALKLICCMFNPFNHIVNFCHLHLKYSIMLAVVVLHKAEYSSSNEIDNSEVCISSMGYSVRSQNQTHVNDEHTYLYSVQKTVCNSSSIFNLLLPPWPPFATAEMMALWALIASHMLCWLQRLTMSVRIAGPRPTTSKYEFLQSESSMPTQVRRHS